MSNRIIPFPKAVPSDPVVPAWSSCLLRAAERAGMPVEEFASLPASETTRWYQDGGGTP